MKNLSLELISDKRICDEVNLLVGSEKLFCFMLKIIWQIRYGHYSTIQITKLLARNVLLVYKD